MMFYPEEVVLPWISMRLNRPVKWIEDRLEHFFATTHERGQIHDAEMAVARDGRILEQITLAKDDPDPHGMCMYNGHLYYCDAGIAPGGKSNGSPSAGYVSRID